MRGNEHVVVASSSFFPASEWGLLCHTCLVGNLSNDGSTSGSGEDEWGGPTFIVMLDGEKGVLSIHKRRSDVNVNWPFFLCSSSLLAPASASRISSSTFSSPPRRPLPPNSEQTNNSFILGGNLFFSLPRYIVLMSRRTQGCRNFTDLTSFRFVSFSSRGHSGLPNTSEYISISRPISFIAVCW